MRLMLYTDQNEVKLMIYFTWVKDHNDIQIEVILFSIPDLWEIKIAFLRYQKIRFQVLSP